MNKSLLRLVALIFLFIVISTTFLFLFTFITSGSTSVIVLKDRIIKHLADGDFSHIFYDVSGHLAAGMVVTFFLFNYHAVIIVLRRRIRPTDEQVVGTWYVSRYLKKNTTFFIQTDTWSIERDFLTGRYSLESSTQDRSRRKNDGFILYNERDRFTVLITGHRHKEQSCIAFYPSIPKDDDSRMVGLGVGDDHQYTVSSRIYLASRRKLTDASIKPILDNATAILRRSIERDPIMQIFPSDLWPIFDATPVELAPQNHVVVDSVRNARWQWRKRLLFVKETKTEQEPLSAPMDTKSPDPSS